MKDYDIEITVRDRLLRAWENSVELVRDYECYSKEVEEGSRIAEIFKKYAEDEGKHAKMFLDMIREWDAAQKNRQK